jgi:hypothetical protein
MFLENRQLQIALGKNTRSGDNREDCSFSPEGNSNILPHSQKTAFRTADIYTLSLLSSPDNPIT